MSEIQPLDPFGISLGVLPAFVAALVGGLDSMPGVMLGAALVGLTQGMVPAMSLLEAWAGKRGTHRPDSGRAPTGARHPGAHRHGAARRAAGDRRREGGCALSSKGFYGMVGLVGLLVWPLIPGVPYDMLNTAILTWQYLLVALSLVLLIGLVGQISLAQSAFVGMGAFTAALASQKLHVHFPYTLAIGGLAGAGLAAMLGAVALRVRGLYLAVATMIFAWICDQYLFLQPWFVGSPSGTSIAREAIGHPGSLPYFDLTDAHIFYYVALAVAGAAFYAVANLRDSRVGRAFVAIRGSEVAAASLGINVMWYKLSAFAVAGGLAGLSGAVLLAGNSTVNSGQFQFSVSLFFLSVAVVGGLRSLGVGSGVVAVRVLVDEIFFRFPAVNQYLDLVSAGLLIAVLLVLRGGLGALPARALAFWRRHQAGREGRLPRAIEAPWRALVMRLDAVAESARRLLPRLHFGARGRAQAAERTAHHRRGRAGATPQPDAGRDHQSRARARSARQSRSAPASARCGWRRGDCRACAVRRPAGDL